MESNGEQKSLSNTEGAKTFIHVIKNSIYNCNTQDTKHACTFYAILFMYYRIEIVIQLPCLNVLAPSKPDFFKMCTSKYMWMNCNVCMKMWSTKHGSYPRLHLLVIELLWIREMSVSIYIKIYLNILWAYLFLLVPQPLALWNEMLQAPKPYSTLRD